MFDRLVEPLFLETDDFSLQDVSPCNLQQFTLNEWQIVNIRKYRLFAPLFGRVDIYL